VLRSHDRSLLSSEAFALTTADPGSQPPKSITDGVKLPFSAAAAREFHSVIASASATIEPANRCWTTTIPRSAPSLWRSDSKMAAACSRAAIASRLMMSSSARRTSSRWPGGSSSRPMACANLATLVSASSTSKSRWCSSWPDDPSATAFGSPSCASIISAASFSRTSWLCRRRTCASVWSGESRSASACTITLRARAEYERWVRASALAGRG
jgi:hypothetical protein